MLRARAAWLWSRRRGIVAGRSASALHGAKWIDNRAPAGLGTVDVRVTTPARTAFDLACRYPVDEAVSMIDALAQATRLKVADVELVAQRYTGHRRIRNARLALDLVDPGAESPRETWLRLLLIRAGFPRPETQIPVYDAYSQLIAVLDMGWQDIKVAVDYEGDQHRTDRRRFNKDIRRAEAVAELGWIDVRITADDTQGSIIWRVLAAWDRRT